MRLGLSSVGQICLKDDFSVRLKDFFARVFQAQGFDLCRFGFMVAFKTESSGLGFLVC